MIYPVYVYGMPVLRKTAREIEEDHEGLAQLIEDMFETMYLSDGVGLAAPQIGLSLRLIVIDASAMEDEEHPELQGFRKVLINPEIIEEEGEEWMFSEGCLSLPTIREDVLRKSVIRVQYYDQDFTFRDERYDGIKARIIQHECDHLKGILFTDKVSPLKKRLLKNKLADISKGKVEVKYKIIHPK
jgi:peptide deformylase